MIPIECKRLAEVDFPIAVVSKHAAREKSIRHGHPSTLHLWWARRPLASSRAVLMALLLPDPCDPHCPAEFKDRARVLLPQVQGAVGASDEALQRELLKFIGDFANWDLASHPRYLEVARGLVRAAHPEETPLVVDPFAGGGSIPLEALRLGCDAFASDLNPVACLILKVMLEDIPRHGPKLAEELRRVGAEIKQAAERELAEFYPPDPDGARPIAYLWARTVRCEAPHCGAEIPLVRSFWLSKKAHRNWALHYRIERSSGEPPRVEFDIFEPVSEAEVPKATVSRAKATCAACNSVLAPERVRAQLFAQQGGADVVFNDDGNRTGGARLLAVVTARAGEQKRRYRLPQWQDYQAVHAARRRVAAALDEWTHGSRETLCPIPNEPLPPVGTLGFRVQRYGIVQWGDLFTARQKLVLLALAHQCRVSDDRVRPLLALTLGRQADYLSSLCTWHYHNREKVNHTFSRQALPFVTDFVETVFSGSGSGGWDGLLDWSVRAVDTLSVLGSRATSTQADAAEHPVPDQAVSAWFTDPPYYDAVPYADLSDFFFVWLKRAVPDHPLLRDPFDPENPLTPKQREAVQDETKRDNGHIKDRVWFEEVMSRAFAEGRRVLREDGVASVVFAHKTTEGWEALLSGMIRGGWTITGSWPLATEMATRLRARESAALATSIHLICRPRLDNAPIGGWEEVRRELPRRVGQWMERLQAEGIRGADLVFACIGPALEIYSRYARVLDAEDREIPLGGDAEAVEPHRRGYLAYVWEVVGRSALQQVLGTGGAHGGDGAAGALEEDSRLTALFLWTLQSSNGEATAAEDEEAEDADDQEEDEEEVPRRKVKGFSLVFDVVRRFAQPLGIHLPEWEGRIIEIHKGVVRLLPVTERSHQLFGEDVQTVASSWERDPGRAAQMTLFGDGDKAAPRVRGRGKAARASSAEFNSGAEATTLDRVHAAMLLQRSGRGAALRALLSTEQERGSEFLRLANALSALYPAGSEEKRLLDALLVAIPR